MSTEKKSEQNLLLDYFNGDELAANVWLSKYALEEEKTPDDMHRRIAKEFARIEKKYTENESNDNEDALSSYGLSRQFDKEYSNVEDKIYNYFKDFKYIIPQGSIMASLGSKTISSLSNCFVLGTPEDSYGGIFEKDEQLAQLMKRRGGVGLDISTLRPEGVATSNAAKSSTGAISFMRRFSNTTREVAQNGRRGALMLSIDINHPDVLEFIKIKRDLTQVTGANISIKLNNEFMTAVENDEDYILRFPCDLKLTSTWSLNDIELNKLYEVENSIGSKGYVKYIKAKEYWEEIIKSAHNVAEPGLMFWDTMVDYSPDGVYPQFKQVTTNPCSEIAMQPFDACRLIAVNLYSFVENPFTDEAYFDFEKFYKINYEAMRLSDDLIDLELEHIDKIIEKINSDPENESTKARELTLWIKIKETAQSSRRTGLGFTALGDTLAALNLKYDSDEALVIIDKIMKIKLESELDCTIDLAILRDAFEGWNNEIEFPNEKGSWEDKGSNDFYTMLISDFFPQFQRMYRYGRRNVSWSTVAPTGTVSLLAQTTSGVEPLFMPYYMRRKKVNPNDKGVRVDFTDETGDNWQEYPVVHPKFKDWMIANIKPGAVHTEEEFAKLTKEDLQRAFELSPWYKSTANDIDWVKRVKIQSTIQQYISHSISSTINLPEDVSEEQVSQIYLESWKQGLKGVTVYREGSRSGVLVSSDKKEEAVFEYKDAPKRPKELDCEIHVTISKGQRWNVIVGLFENKPYEVFAIPYFTTKETAILKKVKQGRYDLITEEEVYSEDITSEMSNEQEVITRLISTSLRHGADIKFIVEQLNKSHGDITSFNKAIARVLKKYIPEGEKSTTNCKECNSTEVVFEEGCHKCLSCGNSACG